MQRLLAVSLLLLAVACGDNDTKDTNSTGGSSSTGAPGVRLAVETQITVTALGGGGNALVYIYRDNMPQDTPVALAVTGAPSNAFATIAATSTNPMEYVTLLGPIEGPLALGAFTLTVTATVDGVGTATQPVTVEVNPNTYDLDETIVDANLASAPAVAVKLWDYFGNIQSVFTGDDGSINLLNVTWPYDVLVTVGDTQTLFLGLGTNFSQPNAPGLGVSGSDPASPSVSMTGVISGTYPAGTYATIAGECSQLGFGTTPTSVAGGAYAFTLAGPIAGAGEICDFEALAMDSSDGGVTATAYTGYTHITSPVATAGGTGPSITLGGPINSTTLNVHSDVPMQGLVLVWQSGTRGAHVIASLSPNSTDASILAPDDPRIPVRVYASWTDADGTVSYSTYTPSGGFTLTKPVTNFASSTGTTIDATTTLSGASMYVLATADTYISVRTIGPLSLESALAMHGVSLVSGASYTLQFVTGTNGTIPGVDARFDLSLPAIYRTPQGSVVYGPVTPITVD